MIPAGPALRQARPLDQLTDAVSAPTLLTVGSILIT